MRETLSVILNEREGSATVVRKIGKISFKVIDSSLCVTIPFPVLFTKHLTPVQNDDFEKARH